LNREVNPILSEAVWGAGWWTGAQHTNYADSQMQFSGALTFELQGGLPTVWNLISDWLVNWRVYPQSMIVSPNGLAIQSFQADPNPTGNTRGGVWMNSAGFTVDPAASIKLNCNVIGLQRSETYSASTYRAVRTTSNVPTLPLNPAPINRNPFPGWLAQAQVNLWPPNFPAGGGWPGGAPPNYSPTNPTGMFMMGADWTMNNNTQVVRGCLAADSRIMTPIGYHRIDSLLDEPGRVLSEHGIQRHRGLVYQGKRDVLRIRTELHNDIRVTPDHKMRVMRGDGTLSWKRADELGEGDWLLCRRGHGGLIPEDRGGSIKRWYAIGHLYGDGSQDDNGRLVWQVTESEKSLVSLLEDFFQEEGLEYSESIRPPFELENGEMDCEQTQFYLGTRKADRSKFTEIPSYQPKGRWREKGLPEQTWSLGEKQLGALLRGLFTTDGGVRNGGVIHFSTKYRFLARDVRRALHLLGVISTITPTSFKSEINGRKYVARRYDVRVVGIRSRKWFLEKVGFALDSKQDALESYFANRTQEIDKSLYVPYAQVLIRALFPGKYVYKARDREEDATTARIKNVRNGHSNVLAETTLPRIIQRAETLKCSGSELQLLRMYQAQDWYFDKVERVTPWYYPVDVYDVYESSTRSFIANGITVSNCTGDPNPAAVFQGVMSVDGTMRLFRDGVIPDPYAYQWPPVAPFTASTTNVTLFLAGNTGGGTNPTITFAHVLLTSEEFAIAGQNEVVPRTFGFGGLGDGTAPPMAMSYT
jgi:intein/homing endonuclease